MARPAAFIFDCDGTILDSMGMWITVQPRFLARYGIEATDRDFARFEHLSMEEECVAYHETWGIEESGEAVRAVFTEVLREQYTNHVEARDGVQEFLEEAHRAGIPMGIATSTQADLVAAGLAAQGLDRYFLTITTTGEAGRSKQFPDVYELALERVRAAAGLGPVDYGDVWVFEDAPFGLRSARDAGMRTLGIFDPHGRAARDEVRSLSDVFVDGYPELTVERLAAY